MIRLADDDDEEEEEEKEEEEEVAGKHESSIWFWANSFGVSTDEKDWFSPPLPTNPLD